MNEKTMNMNLEEFTRRTCSGERAEEDATNGD